MKSAFYAFLLLLATFCTACQSLPTSSFAKDESDLRAKAAPAKPEDYAFEAHETPDYTLRALGIKPSVATQRWTAEELKSGITIGWYDLLEKATGKRNITQAVLQEKDSALVVQTMDLQGKALEKIVFTKALIPNVASDIPGDPHGFCDTEACSLNFHQNVYPQLLAQANATCHNVYYCLACPIPDPCIYMLVVVKPTRKRCQLIQNVALDLTFTHLREGIGRQ